MERNYKSSTIGGMTANQTATACPPSREVAFSVLSEIESITNDGINLAARIADSLGGSSPQVCDSAKDSPMDLLSKLVQLRSSVIELNQQLNRTANALGV